MDQHRTVIAVDLAKTVFEIAVSHTPGDVADTRRLSRTAFLAFFRNREPVIVAMEACGSAHYWAREIQALGHVVELIPPHLVRPYVTRNKTDRSDAKGMPQGQAARSWRPVETPRSDSSRSRPSLSRSSARSIASAPAGSVRGRRR